MSSAVVLQAVLSGLAIGSVYGLVALGYSLVFRLTGVLNFAHGDLVVGAVFAGLYVVVGTTSVALAPGLGRSVLLVTATLAAGAGLAALLYVLAVRPYFGGASSDPTVTGRAGGAVGWVAATIAAGLLVREAAGLVFPREAYSVPDPLRLNRWGPHESFRLPGGQTLPTRLVGVLVIGLLVGLAVERLVIRSRVGLAMRAVAEDRDTASLLGVSPQRVALLAFVIAGLLAGLAGLLVAPSRPLAVSDGVILGLKGAAAAVAAGLGSLRGALVAGLAIGVLESLAVNWTALGPAYTDVLPLALLVAMLALRPTGLFRRPELATE